MATDTEEKSLWAQALETYRDIEVAKRAQPKLVQGAEQSSVPMQYNLSAPAATRSLTEDANGLLMGINASYILYGSVALLGFAMLLKLRA